MTIQRLKQFFSSFKPHSSGRLPVEALENLQGRQQPELLAWLVRCLPTNPAIMAKVRSEALAMGWSEPALAHLEVSAWHQLGALDRLLMAAEPYTQGASFDPQMFILAVNADYQLGRFEAAYHRFLAVDDTQRQVLSERADYANLGALVCAAVGQMDGMRAQIERAWQLAPSNLVIASNALEMFLELGDMDTFTTVRQTVVEGCYPLEQVGVALAVTELAQDSYKYGFRLLEYRYCSEQYRHQMNPALFSRHRWQGEPLNGKRLVVSAEQGLGDTLQCARFLSGLASWQPEQVIVETPPETITLLEASFPNFIWLPHRHGQMPEVEFDAWVAIMSLPHLLGARSDTLPGRSGYLRAPTDNTNYWQSRVPERSSGTRPRIGLAWSGKPSHPADRRRSISFPIMMAAIRDVDADFFALQTMVPTPHPANLIDFSSELLTLADTAALIGEMDLVITIDSCPAHLAGALGKETWLLLPYRYEWRWSLEGESNHWYNSVKVLRQRTHGDWEDLLVSVMSQRLPEFVAQNYRKGV